MEEGRRDLRKEGLLGRNHSWEDKTEKRPEDWCGRLFVKNCFNNAFYLFKYILYDETLPLLILRSGIYSEPKFGHITEICQFGQEQEWPQAEVWRCWCIQVCLLSLLGTFIHYINKLRLVHEGSEIRRTDMTDETANIPEDPDMWISSWSSFSPSWYSTDQKHLSTKPQSHEKKIIIIKIIYSINLSSESEEMGWMVLELICTMEFPDRFKEV